MRLSFTALALAAGSILISPNAVSQVLVTQTQTMTLPGGVTFDSFGRAVDISGDLAVVAAHADDDKGSVTVYNRVGEDWVALQKLTANDGTNGDQFGFCVEIVGGKIFIGAPGDDDGVPGSGSVYVFANTGTWGQTAKLHAPDPQADAFFGSRIGASGEYLVVGASAHNEGALNAGAVYVFQEVAGSWTLDQKLVSPHPVSNGAFGGAVAMSGTAIAVGASGENPGAANQGRVYVFRKGATSWALEQELLASDGGNGDYLGFSIAMDGGLIVAGAYRQDLPVAAGGAVYVYRYNGSTWTEERKLQPEGHQASDLFGFDVDVQGNRIVAGAAGAPAGNGNGAISHFRYDGATWVEAHHWIASSGGSSGFLSPNLGFSVAVDGDRVLGGAPWADGQNENSGAAYAFEATDCALSVTPKSVFPGDTLTFNTYGGSPGGASAAMLRTINGIQVEYFFHFGTFDADGRDSLSIVAPAGLAGFKLGFLTGGVMDINNALGASNLSVVRFL